MDGRVLFLLVSALFCSVPSCSREDTVPPAVKQPAQQVIVKAKPRTLSEAQKAELSFPPAVIAQVEAAAGAPAEPFYEEVMIRSSNLKGDVMISAGRLTGISVHTPRADEVIAGLSKPLRDQGFLIFRSEQNLGSVPDVVTVVRGSSSYDILKIQRTEGQHYHLSTQAIIAWLKEQQRSASFVVTGAGADWLEAKFVKQPKNMTAFARKVAAFAPDVLREGSRTVDKLAETMSEANGFRLVWD